MVIAEDSARKRIIAIDILRGLVMVVMALDHTRDFFSNFKFEPTDLQHASTIMFLTRWITHFCAPVFVFLSGTSAFLSGKNKPVRQVAMRLFTRGLWLIVLEFTFVREGWTFDLDYSHIFLQVIWALGCSMIFLSVLVFLQRQLILAIGIVMIFGHNAMDGIHLHGTIGVMWDFLHVQGPLNYHGDHIMIMYPLIPWMGVMAVGYCFGALFLMGARKRNRLLYMIGMSAMMLFVVLRAVNIYGDPRPWSAQPVWWRSILSFINCTKYPPSLLYLLMTLGPAVTLLPLLEKMTGAVGGIFIVYGRVPLFYYVLHLYLIHSIAIIAGYLTPGNTVVSVFAHPGYSLPAVYGFWLLTVVILYLPCRWFMGVKARHKNWWLSYL